LGYFFQTDRLEAVSDSELADDESKSRQDAERHLVDGQATPVDLENIESDEELPDLEAKNEDAASLASDISSCDSLPDDASPKDASPDDDAPICRRCRLSFVDADGLASHEAGEVHQRVVAGSTPDGLHGCLVCWLGFEVNHYRYYSFDQFSSYCRYCAALFLLA
jgi:hypothetical protein